MTHQIEQNIMLIRGQKVIMDSDLAQLYGVTTKRLNEQVKRNIKRFPEDFMFQLTIEETKELLSSRSQFATLKRGQNIKYAQNVFTEHGAVMLASVLNSDIAISASIQIVKAFVQLRSVLAVHQELAQKLESLEAKSETKFKIVFELIQRYMNPEEKVVKKRIGFDTEK